jgi:hypothetical protein
VDEDVEAAPASLFACSHPHGILDAVAVEIALHETLRARVVDAEATRFGTGPRWKSGGQRCSDQAEQ